MADEILAIAYIFLMGILIGMGIFAIGFNKHLNARVRNIVFKKRLGIAAVYTNTRDVVEVIVDYSKPDFVFGKEDRHAFDPKRQFKLGGLTYSVFIEGQIEPLDIFKPDQSFSSKQLEDLVIHLKQLYMAQAFDSLGSFFKIMMAASAAGALLSLVGVVILLGVSQNVSTVQVQTSQILNYTHPVLATVVPHG